MSLVVGHRDAFDLDLDLLHHRGPATINRPMNGVVSSRVWRVTYGFETDPMRLLAKRGARFRCFNVMTEGVRRQASPSTCIGIVRCVMIWAVRHWARHVPCPPACSKGCQNTNNQHNPQRQHHDPNWSAFHPLISFTSTAHRRHDVHHVTISRNVDGFRHTQHQDLTGMSTRFRTTPLIKTRPIQQMNGTQI